jgi:molybdopterin converting factor small subunit
MRITVRYLAQLKEAAGIATEIVTSEERSTHGLLMSLGDHHGDALRRLLLDADGQPNATILVFVNDRQVEPGMELNDGDVVTLLSPIAGG